MGWSYGVTTSFGHTVALHWWHLSEKKTHFELSFCYYLDWLNEIMDKNEMSYYQRICNNHRSI